MEDMKRRLLWHGMFLFLLGLLTGLAEPQFRNLRMGCQRPLYFPPGWPAKNPPSGLMLNDETERGCFVSTSDVSFQ